MSTEQTASLPCDPTASETLSPEPETPLQTFAQRRAAFVLECVKRQLPAADGASEAPSLQQAQEYRRIIQELPVLVMTNGLGQVLAFLMADAKSTAKQAVIHDLTTALTTIRGVYADLAPTAPLVERLVTGNREMLRQATDETLALLAWWVRFVRAFLPASEGTTHGTPAARS